MAGRWSRAGIGAVVVAIIFGVAGGGDLWSNPPASTTASAGGARSTAQAATSEAENLQNAFMRISQQVGPAVVSISTEQVEQIRQYFRGHPFFGFEDPEDFFRQFYGELPERELRRFGLGSGVIIDERGLILTNEHVVANADKITVTLADGREFSGEVKGKDPRSDLAVIKIDAKNLPVAKLGDSSIVRTGQWAIALGNPFGLMGAGPASRVIGSEPTLTVGVVSALNRQLPRTTRFDRDYSDLFQTDAAINPGNSGGPLLNIQGEVIGINVAILTSSRGSEGIGFAIPINKAKNVLDALIEGKKVAYGWLGIQIQDITDDVADYYRLTDRNGVLVYSVLRESPAIKAGLRDGDIIKAIDGQAIRYSRELIDRVSHAKPGQKMILDLLRDGAAQKLTVEIGERSDLEPGSAATSETAWRGLQVSNLTPEQAERFTMPSDTTGVLVVDVEQNSPAEQAGLRPGDVINQVGKLPIANVNDYRAAIAQEKGDTLVRTTRGYFVIKAR
ncbi:MAG: Do family serine endopeptidase [Candidatus Omnitrophica bacterium]|nr:Do family serine endopeptidase [Candidatus Omnitrophota bacterium]